MVKSSYIIMIGLLRVVPCSAESRKPSGQNCNLVIVIIMIVIIIIVVHIY